MSDLPPPPHVVPLKVVRVTINEDADGSPVGSFRVQTLSGESMTIIVDDAVGEMPAFGQTAWLSW